MSRYIAGIVAVLGTAVGTAFADVPKKADSCSRHGTSIDFFATPSEAAAAAKKAEKLVFVLHVSGHFETPEFT